LRLSNAAVLEAEGRKIIVQTTDEAEVAIGIQRVLREKVITACFPRRAQRAADGQLRVHTHVEGVAGHSHNDASSKLVQTADTASGDCGARSKRRDTRRAK
jgi:hypothetical protein